MRRKTLVKHFGCEARLLFKTFGCEERLLFKHFGCEESLLFKHFGFGCEARLLLEIQIDIKMLMKVSKNADESVFNFKFKYPEEIV